MVPIIIGRVSSGTAVAMALKLLEYGMNVVEVLEKRLYGIVTVRERDTNIFKSGSIPNK